MHRPVSDCRTPAFLEHVRDLVLAPRGLDHRVQFPGPGGTNAVEAALKLARKVTGRHNVGYFERGFHGMTLGALAVTANPAKRAAAGVPLPHGVPMPFDHLADDERAVTRLLRSLEEASAGGPLAAVVVVETVQGEGGINPARPAWLNALASWTRAHGTLLVVDDIQMGCGRTGPFFSFESSGITPDIICLSKSISGYGMPMALTLMRPEYDVWQPGEHNGTFRGYNPAFVTAARALEVFWSDHTLQSRTVTLGERVRRSLTGSADRHGLPGPRGRGLVWGLHARTPGRGPCGVRHRLLCGTAAGDGGSPGRSGQTPTTAHGDGQGFGAGSRDTRRSRRRRGQFSSPRGLTGTCPKKRATPGSNAGGG